MRIISGKFKGRHIKTKKGIRSTESKLRRVLFDILKDSILGSRFLELFCGSGSVGMEALSRGAKEVLFVEKNPECIGILKENLINILSNNYSILKADAFKAIDILLKGKKRFDIIFLDPPFYKGLAKESLNKLSTCDILTANGIIAVQHYKKDFVPEKINKLAIFKQKKYGDTFLSFYRKI